MKFNPDQPIILVGLGNSGDKYKNNRHNVGFMAIDQIHDRFTFEPWRVKYEGQISAGFVKGQKCILLKPQTFMNESGKSVGQLIKYHKYDTNNIVIFYDELDLPAQKQRTKFGGGLAGHNGLKSIKAHLGTENFWRVRIGIGHPGDKNKVSNYVLSDFPKSEQNTLNRQLENLAEHLPILLTGDHELYMTKVSENMKG